MSEPSKICASCGIDKPVGEFRKNTRNKDGLHSWCETCFSEKNRCYQKKYNCSQKGKALRRKWKEDNPVEYERMLLKSHLKRHYKLSLEQYDSMLEEQGGTCAICKSAETTKNRKYLSVDHDHATGEVRGLLCHKCNVLLGYARDNLLILNAALEYLDNG